MKKITYLVAPLMVMPFLLGCNKVTTHKVIGLDAEKLTFTTMQGKELKNSAFNEKQELQFKVSAAKVDEDDPADPTYTVLADGIGIYIGIDAKLPLLEGYTVEYTNELHTEAIVTLPGSLTTDDIYIRAIAAKKDNYIVSVPIHAGLDLPVGKYYTDWQPKGQKLELAFTPQEGHQLPGAQDILLEKDWGEFVTAEEADWATVENGTLTIPQGKVENYLLVSARASDYSGYLEAYSWSEIKELSKTGYALYIFDVGDEKTVKLNVDGTEVTHKVKLIGFNHDTEYGTGESIGLTFQFTTAISDKDGNAVHVAWNNSDGDSSKNYDYESFTLSDFLNNTVLGELPQDLQDNITVASKKYGRYSRSAYSNHEYGAKLFPLADIEVSENPRTKDSSRRNIYCLYNEGVTYSYYRGDDVHDKRAIKDVNNNSVGCWLRSPNTYGSRHNLANCFDADGYLVNGRFVYNTAEFGVAPAFCI